MDDVWDVEIHHINVGQGDSTYFLVKKNEVPVKTVLIDAGKNERGQDVCKYIKNLLSFYDIKKVRIDIAVESHEHDDHFGGIRWLVKKKIIKKDQVINRKSRIADFTDIFDLDDDNAPKLILLGKNFSELNEFGGENGNSLVFLLHFNDFLYYTAGDMDKYEVWDSSPHYKMPHKDDNLGNPFFTALGRLLCYQNNWTNDNARKNLYDYLAAEDGKLFYNPPPLPSPITAFKVSHHGANNDNVTSKVFLDSIKPKVGVISVGDRFTTLASPAGGGYNHPRTPTLKRLDECDTLVHYFATNMVTEERAYYKDEHAMVDETTDNYSMKNFDVLLQEFVNLKVENVPEVLHHRLTAAQDPLAEDIVYKYLYMKDYFEKAKWPKSNLITANEYTIWLQEESSYSFINERSYSETETAIFVKSDPEYPDYDDVFNVFVNDDIYEFNR